MELTKEHLAIAAQIGACQERLRAYKLGTPLSEVRNSDLMWIVDRLGDSAAELMDALSAHSNAILYGRVPLDVYGDGDGYGYGSGYGDGDGDGYGYGDGDGYGYGYGAGYGSGDGYGYGYGAGAGDGYGYGDGDGDGYGYGLDATGVNA